VVFFLKQLVHQRPDMENYRIKALGFNFLRVILYSYGHEIFPKQFLLAIRHFFDISNISKISVFPIKIQYVLIFSPVLPKRR